MLKIGAPVIALFCTFTLCLAGQEPLITRPLEYRVGLTAGHLAPDYGLGVKATATAFVDADLWAKHVGLELGVRESFGGRNQTSDFSMLLGPRLFISKGRISGYGRGQLGFGHFSVTPSNPTLNGSVFFVTAVGGGAEARLTRSFSWRVIDGQYEMWHHFNDIHYSKQDSGRTPVALSTGVVYRF